MARRKNDPRAENKKRSGPRDEAESHGVDSRLRVDDEIRLRENRYYRRVSERYRLAGFALFLILIVFCGFILVRYGEYISYDNFVYLVRDLDSRSSKSSSGGADFDLELDDCAVVRPFRDGFVVAERTSVTVYDSTGEVLLSESESFSYPALAVSDKYIIAYDIGGKSYSVYNSVTRIVSKQTEKSIVCASVCDNGTFTVTTESDDAKYVTEMFNTALKNICHFFTDKFVVSAAVGESGDSIAAAALSENGADYACEVAFSRTSDETPYATLYYSMSLPLELAALDGGGYALVCDDSIRFFSSDGSMTAEHTDFGSGLVAFDAEPWGVILVCSENSMKTKNRVYVFDAEGKLIYNAEHDERVTDARLALEGGECVGYLTAKNSVTLLLTDGTEQTVSVDGTAQQIIETSGAVYACLDGRAVALDVTGNGDKRD